MDQSIDQLIRPVKVLAKSWDVNIALILEDYQQQLVGQDDDWENSQEVVQRVDFSKAAQVLQSSAAVYQKKVQYLLQLVQDIILKQNQEKSRKRKRKNNDKNADDEEGEDYNYDQFFITEEDIDQNKQNQSLLNYDLPQLQQRKILPAILQQLGNVENDDDQIRDDYLKHVRNVCYQFPGGVLLLDPQMGSFLEEFREQQQFLTPIRNNNNNNNNNNYFNQFQQNNIPFCSPIENQPPVVDQLTPQNLDNFNMHACGDDDGGDEGGIGAPDDEEVCVDMNNVGHVEQNVEIQTHHTPIQHSIRQQRDREQTQVNKEEETQQIDYFESLDPYDAGKQIKKPIQKRSMKIRKPGTLKPMKFHPENVLKVSFEKTSKKYSCCWYQDAWIEIQEQKRMQQQRGQNNRNRKLTRQEQMRQQEELLEQNLDNYFGGGPQNENFQDSDGEHEFQDNGSDVGSFEFNHNQDFFAPNLETQNFEFGLEHDDRAEEWARLCRQCVEHMMNRAADIQQQTQQTRNVDQWKKMFQKQLQRNAKKPYFDIKQSQVQLVEKIKVLGMTQTQGEQNLEVPLQFRQVLHGQHKYEISRQFLSLLQCYNDGNIEITDFETNENQMQVDGAEIDQFDTQGQFSMSQILLVSDEMLRRSVLKQKSQNRGKQRMDQSQDENLVFEESMRNYLSEQDDQSSYQVKRKNRKSSKAKSGKGRSTTIIGRR